MVALTGCVSAPKESQQQITGKNPNIIIFLTDDNDFSYWGFGGGPKLSPNIDKLVAEGIEAYTILCFRIGMYTQPLYSSHRQICRRCQDTAFRKAYPPDVPYDITWNTFIDADKEATLGEMVQKAGYITGFVGEWHLGFNDSHYHFNAGDNPSDPDIDKKLKAYQAAVVEHIKKTGYDYAASIVPQNNDAAQIKALRYHNLEWYAKGAIDFLSKYKDNIKPFFLIVNITTHHGPCHTESIDSRYSLYTSRLCERTR